MVCHRVRHSDTDSDRDSDNDSAVRIIRIAIYFATSGSQCMDYGQLAMITAVWKGGIGELQLELVISFTTIDWNLKLEASICF